VSALADLYGARPEQLLVGRGSDEAIDLLVRTLCEPGRDGVLFTPPVFGMYAVSARLQGAKAIEVPLLDTEAGLVPDIEAVIAAAIEGNAKLVFLCSPSNPAAGAWRWPTSCAWRRHWPGARWSSSTRPMASSPTSHLR
jgi:Histidinol-phosphate/aromatic aminotransferase and cobyric acid decarboxylase